MRHPESVRTSWQSRILTATEDNTRPGPSGLMEREVYMQVAIIGGGIGGMALALSLHAAGITDVDVYESAPAIRELGVGINLLPHSVRELAELGLLDALLAVG